MASNVYFSANISNDILDEKELIVKAKNNDSKSINLLINKYQNIVNIKVTKYYIDGAEKEDIFQEGLIGLFKAIKNFDIEKDISFKTFANLCIERQIITAIKSSKRQKHLPLNTYVSLNNSTFENDDGEEENQLIDVYNSSTIEDPLDTITKNEYYDSVKNTINSSLSSFEKEVLNKFIEGKSYTQIAESLNSPVKSVDNAIQRIRKKTAKNIENLT